MGVVDQRRGCRVQESGDERLKAEGAQPEGETQGGARMAQVADGVMTQMREGEVRGLVVRRGDRLIPYADSTRRQEPQR